MCTAQHLLVQLSTKRCTISHITGCNCPTKHSTAMQPKVFLKPGLCLFKKTLLHQQYYNQVPGLISAPGYFCLAPASLSEISLRRGPEVSKVRCSFGLLSLFALGPETPSGLLWSAKVMPKHLNAPKNVNPECTFQLLGFSVTLLFIWDAQSCDLLFPPL